MVPIPASGNVHTLFYSAVHTLKKRPPVPALEAATSVAPFVLAENWSALSVTQQAQLEREMSRFELETGLSLAPYWLPTSLPEGIPSNALAVSLPGITWSRLSALANWSRLRVQGTTLPPAQWVVDELRFCMTSLHGEPEEHALLKAVWDAGWVPKWEGVNGDAAVHAENAVLRLASWGLSLEQRKQCAEQSSTLAPKTVVYCTKEGHTVTCAVVPRLA